MAVAAGLALLALTVPTVVHLRSGDEAGDAERKARGGSSDTLADGSPAVPLRAIETGGGRIELVALYRQGPFVRMVISGDSGDGGLELVGRFGPVAQAMQRALLVDPGGATVHRVLQSPATQGTRTCLCTRTMPDARLRPLAYADFQVPAAVGSVVVLGEVTPSFGRHRIADRAPDFDAAGYSWPGGTPPPELGREPFDPAAAVSPLRPELPVASLPGAVTDGFDAVALPADVPFPAGTVQLDNAARQKLYTFVATLKRLPRGTVVTAMGYSDSIGPDAVNLDLSRRRGQAVADGLRPLLAGTGITVQADGRGEADPLAPDVDGRGRPIPANRNANRRVELQVPRAAAVGLTSDGAALPRDATRVDGPAGELATVEVVVDQRAGERFQIGVERVVTDPDLGLVRVDLRQQLIGSPDGPRSSTRSGEALGLPGIGTDEGARSLRLFDRDGVPRLLAGDAAGNCLCPDQQPVPVQAGMAEHLSVRVPVPAGPGPVSLFIPRAGLLRDLPVS